MPWVTKTFIREMVGENRRRKQLVRERAKVEISPRKQIKDIFRSALWVEMVVSLLQK